MQLQLTMLQSLRNLAGSVGSFSTVDLEGFLAGALVLISRSLINNTDFNLVDFIVDRMAYAIKRFVEHELLNGKDTTNKVKGLKAGVTLSVQQAHRTLLQRTKLSSSMIRSSMTTSRAQSLSCPVQHVQRLEHLRQTQASIFLTMIFQAHLAQRYLARMYMYRQYARHCSRCNRIYYGDMTGLATKFSEQMEIEVLREVCNTACHRSSRLDRV